MAEGTQIHPPTILSWQEGDLSKKGFEEPLAHGKTKLHRCLQENTDKTWSL